MNIIELRFSKNSIIYFFSIKLISVFFFNQIKSHSKEEHLISEYLFRTNYDEQKLKNRDFSNNITNLKIKFQKIPMSDDEQ